MKIVGDIKNKQKKNTREGAYPYFQGTLSPSTGKLTLAGRVIKKYFIVIKLQTAYIVCLKNFN